MSYVILNIKRLVKNLEFKKNIAKNLKKAI